MLPSAAMARPQASAAAAPQPLKQRSFAPSLGVVRQPLLPLSASAALHPRINPGKAGDAGGKAQAQAVISFGSGSGTKRVRVRREIPYSTGDGHKVWLRVSTRYAADVDADRTLVRFLTSLQHGEELTGLRVMVLTVNEIAAKCGPAAAACYFPDTGLMVIVGEDYFGGLPTDYVIAHEYGHRIAQYQRNPPFRGSAFWHGPKRWASYERVCSKIRRGQLSVDQFAYWDFPGENFAESYARMHFRKGNERIEWQYAPELEPDALTYARIRADVKRPWDVERIRDRIGHLRPGRSVAYWLKTPLDGKMILDLESRGQGRISMALHYRGREVKGTPRPARYFRISEVICGQRLFKVVLRAGRKASGYRLTTYLP